MIIIRLSGGLGNQMFQYAFGRIMSLKNHSLLILDISSYQQQKGENTNRSYQLNKFKYIDNPLLNNRIIMIFIYTFFKVVSFCRFKMIVKEKNFYSIDKEATNINHSAYFIGFWQSYKYITEFRDIIIKDFSFKNEFNTEIKQIANKITSSESVSVHIRRGDYAYNQKTKSFHGVLSDTYYQSSFNIIAQKLSNPTFYVFSDDIEWVKNNMVIPGKVIYVSKKTFDEIDEMYLMSICNHNIIANSSFSWWGAWLGTYKAKIVIAPDKWLISNTVEVKDLIPHNWIRIPLTN
jgi:hypothetical protein